MLGIVAVGFGAGTLSCEVPMRNQLLASLTGILLTSVLVAAGSAQSGLSQGSDSGLVATQDQPSHEPLWIWGPRDPEEHNQVWLRKRFSVPKSIQSAILFGTADNLANVFLDGELLANVPDWTKPFERSVELTPGEHLLAVRAQNRGGPAGVYMRLTMDLGKGRTEVLGTDSSWRVLDTALHLGGSAAWKVADFDDKLWSDPVAFGPWGSKPWGTPSVAGDGIPDRALSAENVWVPEGFKIELLHVVDPDTQGSWVSICSDGMGMLYTSDQYGALWKVKPQPVGSQEEPIIKRVPVDLGQAQGLCWAFGKLYVVVGLGKTGLYVVSDTNADGELDHVRKLSGFGSGGEHGPHGIVLDPDGESLWIVGGNHVAVPTPAGRVHPAPVWAEDQLLTRLPDANGHARNKLAPGGWVVRTDPEGTEFDLFAIGMRNAYDLAFSPSGDLFTFDSDMEWDVGLPWYRPTRILHLVSGAEYGWRNGSGKWAAHYEDSLPGVLDMGIGSPTGVTFLTNALFPGPWRNAFLVGDWAYGTIYAVFMQPDGASFSGTSRVFARGRPFPVTDMVVAEDGALYITTGGRRSLSGLYRVTNSQAAGPRPVAPDPTPEVILRASLEERHGAGEVVDIQQLIKALGSRDRYVRHAARVALEHTPVEAWAQGGLTHSAPLVVAGSVIGLARSAGDQWKAASLASLARTWESALATKLEEGVHLRALQLLCIRWGLPDEEHQQAWRKRLGVRWGAGGGDLDRDRLRLLVALGEPRAVPLALKNLLGATSGDEALFYAFVLLDAKQGWTIERRRSWFTWMGTRGLELPGGHSLEKYVRNLRSEAAGRLSDAERQSLAAVLKLEPEPKSVAIEANFVNAWLDEELRPHLSEVLTGRNFEQGRMAFNKARCMECHRIAGEGGSMGHDLTGVASRFTRGDLLDSILDPSKEISDQYQDYEVLTRDGILLVGRLEGRSAERVLLRTQPPDEVLHEIDPEEIELQRPHPLSRMPAGLLNVLTMDEVLDLLAYTLSGADPAAICFD